MKELQANWGYNQVRTLLRQRFEIKSREQRLELQNCRMDKALFLEGVCCGIEEFLKVEQELLKQIKSSTDQGPDLIRY